MNEQDRNKIALWRLGVRGPMPGVRLEHGNPAAAPIGRSRVSGDGLTAAHLLLAQPLQGSAAGFPQALAAIVLLPLAQSHSPLSRSARRARHFHDRNERFDKVSRRLFFGASSAASPTSTVSNRT